MADWGNFFVAEVGASAALAGLMAVAISINLARILAFPQLPPRAAEALMMLTGALILASFGLIPGQPMRVFGAEVVVIGLVMMAVTIYNQMRSIPQAEGLTLFKKNMRAVVSAAATIPPVVAGILLMIGFESGLYWLAAGILISLAAGVWSAWVLLIEILR